VISRGVGGMKTAGDLAEDVVKEGYSVFAPAKADFQVVLFPFVLTAPRLFRTGKEFREMVLVVFQNVDAKEAALFYQGKQVGTLVHADGNQRRHQRH